MTISMTICMTLSEYKRRVVHLGTLETADLIREIATLKRDQKTIEALAKKEGRKFTSAESEQHYSLGGLLENAALDLEMRRDSYTGEIDS